MTQRQRRPLEDELYLTKEELSPYLEQFQQLSRQQLASSDSASLIMSMINKVSSPIMGVQVLRNSLAEMESQYMQLYDMIIDKAEMLYLQSFMQDLRRIKSDEIILQSSTQQIKKCIDELNWRINIESASVLNESQQVQQNKDLMKFFEGIRNYQKWQEGIKFQSLQMLKDKANEIQKQVIFKKGFIISKIEKISQQLMRRNKKELFFSFKQIDLNIRMKRVFNRIETRTMNQGFSAIYLQSISPNRGNFVFLRLFQTYYARKLLSQMRKALLDVKIWKDNIISITKVLKECVRKREQGLKMLALNKMNLRPLLKASKITQSVQRLAVLSKKIIVRHMFKKFNIIPKVLFAKLSRAYTDRTDTAFKLLKEIYVEAKLRRPNISQRLKGKILVSLNKHQREPLTLKQLFDKWYLNSHQTKYSKQIYNIWLQGNINKFVVFMRFKNLCDNVNKQMIGKQMQHFIKILCQKFQKYQQHNKKHMLKKWIQNNRRIRRVEQLVKTLNKFEYHSKCSYQRFSLQKISEFCKRRQAVKRYFMKYLLNFISNRKKAINEWSKITNLKKKWGKSKLRAILLNITNQMNQTAKQTLNVFKANRIEGRRKKLAQYHRTFSQYSVAFEKVIQIWRFHAKNTQLQQKIFIQNITKNKTNSIVEIGITQTKNETSKIRDIINKFKQNSKLKAKKIINIQSSFMKIIDSQNFYLKKELLDILVDNWREGKWKKQRLVIQLVHSNVVKQKLSLAIVKNKSRYDTQLLKRQKLTQFHHILQEKIKQNFTIFNKKLFIVKVLQKIVTNYASNVKMSIDKWKAIPLRMRWQLRNKVMKLNNTLNSLMLERLKQCQGQFQNAMELGNFKKKKGVYIMANKFETCMRKYFKKYHQRAISLKEDDKLKKVSNLFQFLEDQTKKGFDNVMQAKAEWPKRLHCFQRLNEILLQKRIRSYYVCWHTNSKQITFQKKIRDEKKRRVLQTLNSSIANLHVGQTKNIIEFFNRNMRIHKLQINFLKKLCDGQAGKLYKGFSIWKSMPIPKNKQKINKCAKFQLNLYNYRNNILKKTLNAFKQSHGIAESKKKQIIYMFVHHSSMSLRNYFDKWKLNKRLIVLAIKNKYVENLFKAAVTKERQFFGLLIEGDEAQRKRKALGIVDNWWANQQRFYLKKWLKKTVDLKLIDIEKKHLLIHLNQIKTNHLNKIINQNVIKKFALNRNLIQAQKYNKKAQGLLRVVQCQSAFKRVLLNQTVDKLKFNHYWGNFKKNNSFHKFLKQKIGTVHGILAFWNTLAMQAKENHKQRIVAQNFDLFNQTLRANYLLILSKSQQQAVKKHFLDRLFNSQQLKFKGYFNLWRQRIKQLAILGELDKKTKASILERINKILNASSTKAVIATIKKFHMNFKITQIQRKFMDKILQTKSGKLVNAFNSWKSVPMNLMKGKFKNYQKFYFNIQNLYKSRLKTVNQSFKEYSQDGNLMKKQSILKLFEMTSLGIRRFYNRWTRFTRQKHSLMQVHYTLKAFANVQGTLQNQYRPIFKDKQSYITKVRAMKRLVQSNRQKIRNYIALWSEAKQEIKARVNKVKEQKRRGIMNLNAATLNCHMSQVIKVIKMFDKNVKMTKISKNFLTRLMMTKTGKVLQFFSVMKTLPDAKLNKRKRKGIIFESKLYQFVMRRLRDTLNPFKDNTYDAETKMKYCIGRLLRACMGENQKKFLIWRNVVREDKILRHTSLFQKIFNGMQKGFRKDFGLVIKDTKGQVQKKKALCRKLINNSSFIQHHAFLLWRQSCRIQDMNTVRKEVTNKTHIKNLQGVLKQHQNKQIIQAINQFRRLLQLRNVQEYTYIKQYKNKKCIAFYNSLKLIEKQRKTVFLDALKANKAGSMLGDQSKKLEAVFKALQSSCQNNMNYLFKTTDQTVLLGKVFNRLYQNQKINLDKTLSLWKQRKNALIFQQLRKQELKRRSLKLINTQYQLNMNKKLINVINQFRKNRILNEIKTRLCIRMLKRKTNNLNFSFLSWKSMPYQQAKKLKSKADKFQKRLLNFMTNNLKETLSAFKAFNFQGIVKKQNAVRNIVRSKMIQSNRMFFSWRKGVNQTKITEKIITLDKFLYAVQIAFKDNLTIFQGSKVNDQRKIRAATHLFNNNVERLRSYVKIWRSSTKMIKLHLFERYLRNFNPQDFNKRLLKIGWVMIQNKKDMQLMKGYINSLWKWKMSNIQASYYTKFIKIMKQSEQMIKFSNLLNKKIYENIHHSFRNILSIGTERTNRKREIVQKYLMRRFRNYFIQFKNSTLNTQINVWRSKYTEVIKAKILHQILTTLLLKSKFIALSTLKGFQQYTCKIQELQLKLALYQDNFVKQAFEKLKYTGHRKLFEITQTLEQKSKQEILYECFQLLKQKANVERFVNHFSMAVLRRLLQTGFNAINKRKEKVIKSRLSIILLQTLITQAKMEQNKEVISQFKKNRMQIIAIQKIYKNLNKKYSENASFLFERGKNLLDINRLLQRLKRAEILRKIVEKQDVKLQKFYLNKMREKQNKWMQLAIQKFATRASLRSSPAISLWRLKTYINNL